MQPYGDHVPRVSFFYDGTLIAGALAPRALGMVGEWAALHRVELSANWERARREETLEAIEPLP